MTRSTRGEVARLFLRLGATAFGGPAAHVALMHHEVVRRKGWLDDQSFLDRVGLTNLIPGPNSTELAMLVGATAAGRAGLVVAGVCFIGPAVAIVLVLAWVYVAYGATPGVQAALYGIKPVVIALVAQAVLLLGRRAVTDWLLSLVAIGALVASLLGIDEIVLLVVGGVVTLVARAPPTARLDMLAAAPVMAAVAGGLPASDELPRLFFVFLKIGAVLYGSGYVLLAFLRTDLVGRLGWLTGEQLLDAVAVGQATPGPLFSTATFTGYLAAGLPGALLASVAIFLPSFLFALLISAVAPRLRASWRLGALLDGVNVAALGLMAAVMLQLGRDAIGDVATALIAATSAAVLLRYAINSLWLVAGGAAAGIVVSLIRSL